MCQQDVVAVGARAAKRTILLATILLCGAMTCAAWAASENEATPPLAKPSTAPGSGATNAMQAAVLRGLNWFVAHKDKMPLGFALKNAEKIRRATADDTIRQRMDALVQEKFKALPTKTPNINAADPSQHNWYALRPAVMDLIYLKSLGKPWKSEAEKLTQMFATHGDAILPARSTLSERLVAAYKLQILGVPTGEIYTNTLAEIRAQIPLAQPPGGKPDMMSLYARTHVIFTASGYYGRYLDPKEFAPEVECFAKAVAEIAQWKELDDSWGDLVSEILIAQKILRQPATAQTELIQKHLLEKQNADGSWGADPFDTGKIHHTAMTILALMEFGPEFKVGIDYL